MVLFTQGFEPVPEAQSVTCSLRGKGGNGFDPRPRHIKIVKIVLAAPCLSQIFELELGLVDPVSG